MNTSLVIAGNELRLRYGTNEFKMPAPILTRNSNLQHGFNLKTSTPRVLGDNVLYACVRALCRVSRLTKTAIFLSISCQATVDWHISIF